MSQKLQNLVKLATAKPLNVDFISDSMNVRSLKIVGIIVETEDVTGATGTFVVQVRSTNDKGEASGWTTLDITPPMVLVNVNESYPITLRSSAFSEVRVKFTAGNIGDDGTCNVWLEGKGGSL